MLVAYWVGDSTLQMSWIVLVWAVSLIASQLLSIAAYKWFEHPVEHWLRTIVSGDS